MNRVLRNLTPALEWVWPLVAVALMLGTACANFRQVFPGPGKVDFVDADCYARMTRVRMVCEHPGLVLARHDFENSPFGTQPHTTVLLDYLVALLHGMLRPFYGALALDLAGAWISPLLGIVTLVGIWLWYAKNQFPGRHFGLALFALSPIVAHGFELGRPDHQSLILATMACALMAEWQLWREPTVTWGLVSGTAWAVGLWTSLYEPLVLLILVLLANLVWNRAAFRQRARLPGVGAGGLILVIAVCIEGWRIAAPPGLGQDAGSEYFAAWTKQIGELASLLPWSPTLYAWCGLGLLAAPALLWLNRSNERPVALANLLMLAAVFLLTCWQARWGYFLPLVYVLSLPWQRGTLPPRWWPAVAAALTIGLWPMANEWFTRLSPSSERQASLVEQRTDSSLLREAAAFIAASAAQTPPSADPPATGILAPWWQSPALAYWSGQPGVAGSSHEALAGTVEAARFFLATDARQAAEILRHRRVRWVVAYEPSRVQSTSASLLGLNPPPPRFLELALYQRPEVVPRYLHFVYANQYFKIYEVRVDSLPHE